MSYLNWGHESPKQVQTRRRLEEATDEQIRMYKAFEARSSSSSTATATAAASAGGSLVQNPQAVTVSAKNIALRYNDVTSGALKFFVVNYEDLTFSPEIVLDADFTNVDGISFRELVAGRGWIIRKTDLAGNRTYFFIDAGGNLIETVDIGTANRSDYSFDGFGSAVSYKAPGSDTTTLKWWGGDTIYTRTFENVQADYVYFNDFNYDSCTVDGTGDFYYYDTSLSTWRYFLFNFYTGVVTEITDLLTYKGEYWYDGGMNGLANFIFTTFRTSNTSSSNASWTNGANTITLSAPNTSISIGDQITAPGGSAIPDSTYIININGTTLTLSQPVTGEAINVGVAFSGSRMEIVRIIRTDGTYFDYDLLQFHVSDTGNFWLVGTDKLIFYFYTNIDALPDTLLSLVCDGIDLIGESSLSIDSAKFPSYTAFNATKLDAFSSYADSPHGAESFGIHMYDIANSINDGKMNRFSPVLFAWTNTVTGEIYTYEPPLGIVNFGNSTPTANAYTAGTTTITPVNPVGHVGDDATFSVTVDVGGSVTDISLVSGGSGYSAGDVLTIPGLSLGGETPADNITISVTELETFGIMYAAQNEVHTAPALLYANSPASGSVQILQLKQDGTTSFTDTVTLYADTGNYFAHVALGDNYFLLSHYDSNEAPTDQFWGIWDVTAGNFIDNSRFFTTTDNSWGTNYDTFWMSENTEGKIYWWNSAQGDLGNTITELAGAGNISNGTYLADDTDIHDYIDYHQTGTTLILDSATQGYLLSSNSTPPALVDIAGAFTTIQLNKTHFYNLRQDVGNNSIYLVDVYDLAGTLIQTVTTSLDTYDVYRVVGDRVFLTQNDGIGNTIIYAISPTDYATKTITDDGWGWEPNDWRYWGD